MSTQPETLLCHYRYNALDQLIGHAQPDEPQHQRFYRKNRLATEIQGAMQYSIFQSGDLLLAQRRSEADALDTTLLAIDQQRSVLHTLEANRQRRPVAYSPYGHRHPENGLLSLLGFNGERPDPVTGHYVLGNGYRAFNPVTMRFNGPDSFSPFGRGGLNSYAYCLGDPINLSDPNGTFPPLLKRMLGRPVYKSGPGLTFSAVTTSEDNYLDVTTFTPHLDTRPHSFIETTHRTNKWGEETLIKSVEGIGYGEVAIQTKESFTYMRRKFTPDENGYSQTFGLDLESFYRNLEMPEIPISIDHHNLLKARNELTGIRTVKQINEAAENGLIMGVRPSRAKSLIENPHFRFDDDRWWEKPTRDVKKIRVSV
ncbi:RHS repeat-associated core domain-containing protein [Pseudomonas sp. PB120]|uniref:RHS repeat-associated core domain-containing protein n=1 Tax=Pseudomonas sp. PB120 TaxID=2494700 RepID=UPI0012FDF5E7|nr:RHS repeat-associated core domain-containing protein [Pseudomonas sp. PB120]MVV46969.1 RHS repeat-associated core domain-containing protein [Pseudomonas sp. PB120]